ncbi:FecR family protein [Stella humosa]|uniref:FecR family protein n=1 Tax=Stella humosa TaxID=94 RepID=A0A3N1KWM1_9PROT|nr:FecR domain-containing protein [Stella humosa]ROP83842.1 FecR family protein [Stella humosa]BBK32897.1 hypothetical protein STHU_35310 [Stella humosa]
MRRMVPLLLGGLAAGAAILPLAAVAADRDIGVSAIVVNKVQAALGGADRTLSVGDRVFQNERIETGQDGRTQIMFLDETTITVGPNSSVVLDTFVYDPDRSRHSVVIEATHGVLRFVSGRGDSRAFQIRTPVATVGVRGTVLDILVARDGATTVMVVEGAADLRAIGSGRIEALDRVGLASTVSNRQSAPTPPAPPSDAVRNRLRVLAPTGRQLATVGDMPLPSGVDTKGGIVIDGTLPAEVIRDRLRQPNPTAGIVPTTPPGTGVQPGPVLPGGQLPTGPVTVAPGTPIKTIN